MPKKREHPPTEITATSTVHMTTLCEVTGLSDVYLLRNAEKGYYPKPLENQYLVLEFLRGIVRYYQEVSDRRNKANAALVEKRGAETDENTLLKRAKRLQLEGQLLDKGAVVRVWQEHIVAARQVISTLPISKKERERVLRELEVGGKEYEK